MESEHSKCQICVFHINLTPSDIKKVNINKHFYVIGKHRNTFCHGNSVNKCRRCKQEMTITRVLSCLHLILQVVQNGSFYSFCIALDKSVC